MENVKCPTCRVSAVCLPCGPHTFVAQRLLAHLSRFRPTISIVLANPTICCGVSKFQLEAGGRKFSEYVSGVRNACALALQDFPGACKPSVVVSEYPNWHGDMSLFYVNVGGLGEKVE